MQSNSRKHLMVLLLLYVPLMGSGAVMSSDMQNAVNQSIMNLMTGILPFLVMAFSAIMAFSMRSFVPIISGIVMTVMLVQTPHVMQFLGMAVEGETPKKKSVQPPRPKTAFEKLKENHQRLSHTLGQLRDNIKGIKSRLSESADALKEKSVWLEQHKDNLEGDIAQKIFELKRQNVVQLTAAIERLNKELAINTAKEAELASNVEILGEYVSEVADAKKIHQTFPDGVLEIREEWLDYDRLHEQIEKELAGTTAAKSVDVTLMEESGRVNGENRLHRF